MSKISLEPFCFVQTVESKGAIDSCAGCGGILGSAGSQLDKQTQGDKKKKNLVQGAFVKCKGRCDAKYCPDSDCRQRDWGRHWLGCTAKGFSLTADFNRLVARGEFEEDPDVIMLAMSCISLLTFSAIQSYAEKAEKARLSTKEQSVQQEPEREKERSIMLVACLDEHFNEFKEQYGMAPESRVDYRVRDRESVDEKDVNEEEKEDATGAAEDKEDKEHVEFSCREEHRSLLVGGIIAVEKRQLLVDIVIQQIEKRIGSTEEEGPVHAVDSINSVDSAHGWNAAFLGDTISSFFSNAVYAAIIRAVKMYSMTLHKAGPCSVLAKEIMQQPEHIPLYPPSNLSSNPNSKSEIEKGKGTKVTIVATTTTPRAVVRQVLEDNIKDVPLVRGSDAGDVVSSELIEARACTRLAQAATLGGLTHMDLFIFALVPLKSLKHAWPSCVPSHTLELIERGTDSRADMDSGGGIMGMSPLKVGVVRLIEETAQTTSDSSASEGDIAVAAYTAAYTESGDRGHMLGYQFLMWDSAAEAQDLHSAVETRWDALRGHFTDSSLNSLNVFNSLDDSGSGSGRSSSSSSRNIQCQCELCEYQQRGVKNLQNGELFSLAYWAMQKGEYRLAVSLMRTRIARGFQLQNYLQNQERQSVGNKRSFQGALESDGNNDNDNRNSRNSGNRRVEQQKEKEMGRFTSSSSSTLQYPHPHVEDAQNAYHAYGAALLAQGQWVAAHTKWREGKVVCGDGGDSKFMQTINKLDKYCLEEEGASNGVGGGVASSGGCTVIRQKEEKEDGETGADIFVTTNPLLTQPMCTWVVQSAEAHACGSLVKTWEMECDVDETLMAKGAEKGKGSGWTTSRHYAVPTMDIPVHEVPQLLRWFKNWLIPHVKPLLLLQFFPHLSSKDDQNRVQLAIHDAFVVKYSCEGEKTQRYLPLHTDESTHSLTIALNDAGEYVGGGTYFQKLNAAVRPEMGQVLCFDGSLVHGGDPLLKGTRYIIAAFLLMAEEGEGKEKEKEGEEEVQDSEDKGKEEGCSGTALEREGVKASFNSALRGDRRGDEEADATKVKGDVQEVDQGFSFSFGDL